MNLLNKRLFVCADLEKNSNKFWKISLYDNHSVTTEYGRVGDSGQSTTKSFSSSQEAVKFFNRKVKEKQSVKTRRDAYTEIHILDDTTVTKSPSRHISDLAAEQIETSSENVRTLVRWFSDRNIHNICQATTISYNISEGCFRTPLGVVDSNCINSAKVLLDEISKLPDKSTKECISKVNQYLRLIPQDLGGSHVKIRINDVFGTGDLLQKQSDIIEGLEAAISSAKSSQPNEISERVFNTKLDICKDESTISQLKERFNEHCGYSRINAVYEITIKDVFDRFVTVGQSFGNRAKLWHATSPRNILSIFKSGLVIPRSYSNGWNHGAGVYFSDRSSKSMQYLSRDNRNGNSYGYMFVGDVALGEVIYNNGNAILPKGKSRWAYKGNSESQIIVYNTDQINILYLLEIV